MALSDGTRLCSWCRQRQPESAFHSDDRGRFWCKTCVLAWARNCDRSDLKLAVPLAQRRRRWTRETVVLLLGADLGLPRPAEGATQTRKGRQCPECREVFGGEAGYDIHRTDAGCWTGKKAQSLTKRPDGRWVRPSPRIRAGS